MITTDIGSGYTVTYGQLKNLKVSEGDEVKEGQLLGVVAKPTQYFSEEGSNLFFQVKENGTALDPLLLLN
jgi:septal ring factor EnvC (AmiA/AmiB activator)